MTDKRPDIPADIKRQVRQRCAFGCVLCGLPLYEYEHMEGWANVQRHVAEEITLLCDRHHKERTNGLLPIEAVRRADKNPYNRRTGTSTSYLLHYSGSQASIWMGSTEFTAQLTERSGPLVPVMIDEIPLMSFRIEDQHILLSLEVYDQADRQLLRIVDNELQYAIDAAWDFQMIGRTLTIRHGLRRIAFRVRFAVPDTVFIENGTFWKNGVNISIANNNLHLVNSGMTWGECGFQNFNAGIVIGAMPKGYSGCIAFVNVPRFKWNALGIFAIDS